MDNQNNPNFPNNPNPDQPTGGPTPPSNSTPVPDPLASGSQPPLSTPSAPSPWSTPTANPPTQQPGWNPSFSTPAPQAAPAQPDLAQASPLDNPWNAPVQPPPFDGQQQNSPSIDTFSPLPSSQPPPAQPAWVPNSIPADTAPSTPLVDSTPTDLSHLISSNPQPENPQTPPASAETLVVPPTNNTTTEVPSLPLENHKAIPKWLIGVGVGLLIVVAGASAYFILGVGQSPKTPTSLPAQTTNETKPPAVASPVAAPAADATGSANFGSLEGSGTLPATSAADLIRQRQQQQGR